MIYVSYYLKDSLYEIGPEVFVKLDDASLGVSYDQEARVHERFCSIAPSDRTFARILALTCFALLQRPEGHKEATEKQISALRRLLKKDVSAKKIPKTYQKILEIFQGSRDLSLSLVLNQIEPKQKILVFRGDDQNHV